MRIVDTYEWGSVVADEHDPNAGGASHHYTVDEASPGIGCARQVFASVQFQHGPRKEADSVMGALDDHLLAISQDRLEAFQAGPFAHPSNQVALEHVKAARKALRDRAEERRARGVLGKNIA